ncbi:MAG: hypothetical protein J6S17_03060, partial [Aeriscardovia sp.]|nr:hypothetical protein [Aeriscardovia sp.]
MLRKCPAKAGKANRKLSIAVIAGVTGLGTMFSIMPASFADTLPSNNGSQSVISKDIGTEMKISGLQRTQTTLISIAKMSSNTSSAADATGYQTQAKQEDLAKSLSTLLSSLGDVLHATPYSSKLSAIQSSLEGIENTLKFPNLTNSDLEGATKTQGQLQDLVKQLQAIINEACAQYGAEIKNAIGDYNASNLLSVETGTSDAVKAGQSVYGTANMANNPNLSSANSTFSANAADASASAGTASSSSSLVGSAEVMEQNANAQLDNIRGESNALYDGSASPATGVLTTDAQNFDSWAQSWISTRNVSSDSQTGYGPYLTALNNAISEIEAGEKDGSLTVQNKTDADTVLTNLKIMQSAVTTLQSEAESDLASKTPEEAYSLAQQYGLGANPTMHQLQTFIKDMLPITGSDSSKGGKSETVPEAVSTYGGTSYGAWPKDNPFGGSDAKTLWGNLSKLQADAAKMPTWGSGPSGNWTSSWGQNVSNYEYLQAVQPYAETITFDSTQVLSAAQDAAAKIQAAKKLADQNTGDAADDAAAAKQAQQDIQSALTDVDNAATYGSSLVQAADGAYSQYSSATASSNPTVTIPYLPAPGGKSATKTVSLPTQTDESPLYAQSALKQMGSNYTDAINQAYQSLSGSTLGNGAGGLLGDATAWQKAIVTQGVLDNAQNAYNDIQKVQQDLKNVKSAADPGAAIDS